ncbi:uncharacterized protein B0I36DRAFT_335574 [Microdochium trichocladiopsis]|uniref:Uncharacterized protein n=1 Tax=Microdochium trichocladiopsis TaxID=1682393 RepID=A0A9P8XUA2_9PEZI|nr:uncharacterized protein B0I36DRAFT_335574 [Microdochium trichocladiopsis]KAH7018247.1 hypothetical protein B0I36DRAFT_335574 [Microdochium trichocladiopsis]
MSDQGGDLFAMAKDGTKVPEDAAKPNIVPSKPSASQLKDTTGGLGAASLEAAADNYTVASNGLGDGITGTGDVLPDSTTAKTFGSNSYGGKNPHKESRGHGRASAVLSSKVNRAEKEEREPERVL